MAINALGEEKNPNLRANSLNELLEWYDADFIRCAYVTMLGRRPDRVGVDHYLRNLRSGRSRLAVLWELRQSAEGRNHDPGIAGLDRALRRAALGRRAGFGWVLRLFSRSLESDSALDRQFRVIMNGVTLNRIEVQQLARSYPAHLAASGGHAPGVEVGPTGARDHARKVRETELAPELKRLAITAPLQQYFLKSAA